MTNRKGNVIVIILALLLLISTSVAIYFWSQTQNRVTDNQIQALISAPNTNDATSSWAVYKNDQYGLSVKYPPTFFLQSATIDANSGSYYQQNSQGLDDPYGVFVVRLVETKYKNQQSHYPEIDVHIYQTKLTAQEWVNKNASSCQAVGNSPCSNISPALYLGLNGIKTIQINNSSAVQFQSEAASSGSTHTLIKNQNYLFDVSKTTTGVGEIADTTYNQILATLTSSATITPATKPAEWKIYSNTSQAPDYKPAVKINYPSTWTVSEQSLEGTADLEVSFKDESGVTGIQLQISSRNFLDDHNSQKIYPVTQTTINNRQAYYFSSTNGPYGWLQVYTFPLNHGYVIYKVTNQKFLNMWITMLPTLNF